MVSEEKILHFLVEKLDGHSVTIIRREIGPITGFSVGKGRSLAISDLIALVRDVDGNQEPQTQKPHTCHPSHKLRDSDASSFDVVCVNCGETDVAGNGWGKLVEPCAALSVEQPAPQTHVRSCSSYSLNEVNDAAADDCESQDEQDEAHRPGDHVRIVDEIKEALFATGHNLFKRSALDNPVVGQNVAPCQIGASPQQHVSGIEDEIARVVQSVNEWDDRTSPDDYPEHLLITSDELADILRNFAASIATEGKDND